MEARGHGALRLRRARAEAAGDGRKREGRRGAGEAHDEENVEGGGLEEALAELPGAEAVGEVVQGPPGGSLRGACFADGDGRENGRRKSARPPRGAVPPAARPGAHQRAGQPPAAAPARRYGSVICALNFLYWRNLSAAMRATTLAFTAAFSLPGGRHRRLVCGGWYRGEGSSVGAPPRGSDP